MRTTLGAGLGAGLALAVSVGVGLVVPSAQAAAPGCDGGATTTWVGPTTSGGSPSWGEPANWTDGVPVATSVVCIPAAASSPVVSRSVDAVADVIDADGATVTLDLGSLSVGTRFNVGTIRAVEGGSLNGPGLTTVSGSLVGGELNLFDDAVVELADGATVDVELEAWDGSRITVSGDVVLGPDANIYAEAGSALFTVTETGSLTVEARGYPMISGSFANHGEVRVRVGSLLIFGTEGYGDTAEQHSTGTFSALSDARFYLSFVELQTGALLDGVTAEGLNVPAEHRVIADASSLTSLSGGTEKLCCGGEGTVELRDGSMVDGRVTDSLALLVPAGETATTGDTTLQDDVRLRVDGELVQSGDLRLEDQAVLDVSGVQRGVIEPEAEDDAASLVNGADSTVRVRPDAALTVPGRFQNEGRLWLGSGARQVTEQLFLQTGTGIVETVMSATGQGRVQAGRRDLGGTLVVRRARGFRPPVGTVRTVVSSPDRVSRRDAFDRVVSPSYGNRRLQVRHREDRVRLRVVRVG